MRYFVSTKQFFGIDLNPTAVELTKVTLMIAKELSISEAFDNNEETLPLDNLDQNIVCNDALFTKWPEVDAIIGNPPYQSHANMKPEFGMDYVNKIWKEYPEISGKADFCVYWFYKAHKNLKEGCYAGLVGTKTIRQNFSRLGSLDYIIKNGGTIVSATSSQKWSGEAKVKVSIVCWKKGNYNEEKILFCENNKGELEAFKQSYINSSLSIYPDVSSAKVIEVNRIPKMVYKGQMPGHDSFMVLKKDAIKLLKQNPEYLDVLKPHLIGEELVGNFNSQPTRFLIDLSQKNIIEASSYKKLFEHIEKNVLPFREQRAKEQENEIHKILKQNPIVYSCHVDPSFL